MKCRSGRVDRECLQPAKWPAGQNFFGRHCLAEAKEARLRSGATEQGRECEFEIDTLADQGFPSGADECGAAVDDGCGESGVYQPAVGLAPDRQEIVLDQLASKQLLECVTHAAERIVAFGHMVKNEEPADKARIVVGCRPLGTVDAFGQPAPGVEDGLGVRMRFKLFHRNLRQTLR